MSTPTHLSFGILITHALYVSGVIPPESYPAMSLWSAITANLPDLDILSVKKIRDHRRGSLLHVPFTWILALTIWSAWIFASGDNWQIPYLYLAAINIFFHFLLDSFNSNTGISWLAPWSLNEYSFLRLTPFCIYSIPKFIKYYLVQPIILVETAIIFAGGLIFLNQNTGWPRKAEAKIKTNLSRPLPFYLSPKNW